MAVIPLEHPHETGQRRDEGLAFAGRHLGDLAFVQHQAADELHVEAAAPGTAGATFGIELADRLVNLRRDRHLLPRLAASRSSAAAPASYASQHLVIELVGIEVLLGIEDLADADVAVHRFANDRERLGQHVGRVAASSRVSPSRSSCVRARSCSSVIAWTFGSSSLICVDDAAITLEQPLVAAAENLGKNFANAHVDHGGPRLLLM